MAVLWTKKFTPWFQFYERTSTLKRRWRTCELKSGEHLHNFYELFWQHVAQNIRWTECSENLRNHKLLFKLKNELIYPQNVHFSTITFDIIENSSKIYGEWVRNSYIIPKLLHKWIQKLIFVKDFMVFWFDSMSSSELTLGRLRVLS